MPPHLCHLTHLQLLHLTLNRITGSIPKCLNNLISLTNTKSPNAANNHSYELLSSRYVEVTIWMWKGREYKYGNNLVLVKSIDLSCNKLIGVIPKEIVMLNGLISLNLSRNLLTGKITSDIGLLHSLEVLDLSDNKLSVEIPSTISLIDRLNSLNLRNNNLSGRIPTGTQLSTFNAFAYEGNPNLCGFPLPTNCLGEETPQNSTVNGSSGDAMQDEKDGFITRGFYMVDLAIGVVDYCSQRIRPENASRVKELEVQHSILVNHASLRSIFAAGRCSGTINGRTKTSSPGGRDATVVF
uniref:Uncharacterized protein n=1 Tax=Quercus lobata TaxID=97700 RepID=A0A7N2LTD9_QUELO